MEKGYKKGYEDAMAERCLDDAFIVLTKGAKHKCVEYDLYGGRWYIAQSVLDAAYDVMEKLETYKKIAEEAEKKLERYEQKGKN